MVGRGQFFWEAGENMTVNRRKWMSCAGVECLPLEPRRLLSAVFDYNDDGLADYAFHDPESGLVQLLVGGTGSLIDVHTVVNPDWWLVSAGEVDDDPTTRDLIWRNLKTGGSLFWALTPIGGVKPPIRFDFLPATRDPAWQLVGAIDLNEDDRKDLLWYRPTDGLVGVWIIDPRDAANRTYVSLSKWMPDWVPVGVADFDGDGRDDILWQKRNGTEAVIWMRRGSEDPPEWLDRTFDPGARIIGWDDYNGDGTPDVLVKTAGGRAVRAVTIAEAISPVLGSAQAVDTPAAPFYLAGVEGRRQNAAEPPASPPPAVKRALSADIDGDGHDDVATRDGISVFYRYVRNGAFRSTTWHNASHVIDDLPVDLGDYDADGRVELLTMDLETRQFWLVDPLDESSEEWNVARASAKWTPVSGGDFNGDGYRDLLWWNDETGQALVWTFDAQQKVTSTYTVAQMENLAWDLVGAGDFNGDGRSDLLWRNRRTGQNLVWVLNGKATTSFLSLPPVADTNYRIESIGDYDGDGRPDLIWRHSQTHQTVTWLLDGTTVKGKVLFDPFDPTEIAAGAAKLMPDKLIVTYGPGPLLATVLQPGGIAVTVQTRDDASGTPTSIAAIDYSNKRSGTSWRLEYAPDGQPTRLIGSDGSLANFTTDGQDLMVRFFNASGQAVSDRIPVNTPGQRGLLKESFWSRTKENFGYNKEEIKQFGPQNVGGELSELLDLNFGFASEIISRVSKVGIAWNVQRQSAVKILQDIVKDTTNSVLDYVLDRQPEGSVRSGGKILRTVQDTSDLIEDVREGQLPTPYQVENVVGKLNESGELITGALTDSIDVPPPPPANPNPPTNPNPPSSPNPQPPPADDFELENRVAQTMLQISSLMMQASEMDVSSGNWKPGAWLNLYINDLQTMLRQLLTDHAELVRRKGSTIYTTSVRAVRESLVETVIDEHYYVKGAAQSARNTEAFYRNSDPTLAAKYAQEAQRYEQWISTYAALQVSYSRYTSP